MISRIHNPSRRCRFGLLFIIMTGVVFLSGCQTPTTYEHAISLQLPPVEAVDPNAPAPKPIDPLDVLAAVETIAGQAGLKPYTAPEDETSLLDIADSDLGNDTNDRKNVTEWKHPELPVYLTVIRKSDEVLILLNHTPEKTGKSNPAAKKLFDSIQKQLTEIAGQ